MSETTSAPGHQPIPEFKQVMGHPSPLWMLFMSEFWERFAFYGIRWALVLYIVAQFHGGDQSGQAQANLTYGSYLALFYAGAAFAYYAVFPLIFAFFTSTGPADIAIMTDINSYLDFVLKLFFAFGLAFEIPIVAVLLIWTGITTPQSLAKKRPYIIVGCFIMGMLLTPPDVISQSLLAIPMWLLFEVGVFMSTRFAPAPEEPHPEYEPMSEQDMERELDDIEREENRPPQP